MFEFFLKGYGLFWGFCVVYYNSKRIKDYSYLIIFEVSGYISIINYILL